jgi:hypothetical protein
MANACGTGGDACSACGAGQTCNNGTCRVDPNSLWTLIVESGTVSSFDGDGNAWDSFGGLPDPYVQFQLCYNASTKTASATGYTKNASNTLHPNWTSTKVLTGVKAYDLLNCVNLLGMWDSDILGGPNLLVDSNMGDCSISFTESMFGGTLQQITCTPTVPSEPTWYVNLRLIPG